MIVEYIRLVVGYSRIRTSIFMWQSMHYSIIVVGYSSGIHLLYILLKSWRTLNPDESGSQELYLTE